MSASHEPDPWKPPVTEVGLRSGALLGSNRIVAPLGAGGTGEVYRAHDTKLDRPVALKILPAEPTRDSDRLRRFVQEAKSASSLSHPNIVVVHDIGQAVPRVENGEPETDSAPVHYIAMELVEGSTLRQLFADRSIEPRTLLAHLAQAAEGLAKAHAAGIVHRDLKPENIMVSRDGYARVFDFGRAKLAEAPASGSALAAAPTTVEEQATREGMVVGTVGYMSPEQALGRPVDHRTDLFAFGCMLYEAATGKRPFTGASHVDVLHAVVREKPKPVEEIAPAIPRALVRTIRRCLAKEPDRRYQSMKDLALELHETVDEWESLETPSGPVSSTSKLSGAAPPAPRVVSRGVWIALAATAAAIVAAASWLWLGHDASAGGGEATAFHGMRITPVTSSGRVDHAALSPDGRYLVYTKRGAEGTSLWLRQLATGSDARLLPPQGNLQLETPVFTSEGSYVDYRLSDEQRNYSTLYRLPVLGGTPREVAFDVDTAPAYSPDGREIAFVRKVGREEQRIVVAGFDGSGERVLASRRSESQKLFTSDARPAWSPDGRTIAASGIDRTAELRFEVVLVDVASGEVRRLGDTPFLLVPGLAWLPDGGGLLASAVVKSESFTPQIWRLGIPGGALSRVTNDTADDLAISLSADGEQLVAVQKLVDSNLWRRSPRRPGGDEQLTFASREVIEDLFPASDGAVFLGVKRGSAFAILRLAPGGGEPVQVTPAGFVGQDPQVTRDGRTLAVRWLMPDGRVALGVMDADGSNLRMVTTRGALGFYASHPDERWLVVADGEGLWRVPLDGGDEALLLDDPRASPAASSPSGDRLAYATVRTDANGLSKPIVRIVPAAGGGVLAELERAQGILSLRRWSPDGRALVARIQEGPSQVLARVPLDGGPPTRIADLGGLDVSDFAIGADGETITYVRVDSAMDAVLIEEFQSQ
jgi:serine/threonine protein kinase/Tol biopolymer transport system component